MVGAQRASPQRNCSILNLLICRSQQRLETAGFFLRKAIVATTGIIFMAPIERKPLPPPNFRATKITEADRAEMIAHANAVIDYYLNGPGSYWDAGPRKPLVGELGDSTVNDLKAFKDRVIASKQFADDPGLIMDSIIDLIDQATGKVEEAARYREGRGGIWRTPPDTDDPIDDPRVISPRFINNGALPIGLKTQPPVPTPQTDELDGTSGAKPIRVLSRRTVNQPRFGLVRNAVEQLSSERAATGFEDEQRTRVLGRRVVLRDAPLVKSVYPPGVSNRVMAPSKSDRPPSPYSPVTPGGLDDRIAVLSGSDSAHPYPRGPWPFGTEIKSDGQSQPWLFRALSGRR
jgi:hypothetical protein